MKTKQLIFMILAIVFATNVFAAETPKLNVIALGEKRVLVAVSQELTAKQELAIISEEGLTVYFAKSGKKESDLSRVFNLSNLKDGTYTVKYTDGAATLKRDLKIRSGRIFVQPLVTEYAPVFAFDNNILKVSYLNLHQNDVVVYVYDNTNLIYKSKLGEDITLQRGFDFSKLDKGDYNIVLASANEKYSYSVTK